MTKAALVLVLLVLTACGSVTPTAKQTPVTTPVALAGPSPSSVAVASPSPVASPTPFLPPSPIPAGSATPKAVAFTCSSQIPAGNQLALVTLRGSTDVVVRDLTNLDKPVNRCAFKHCEQWCTSYGPDNMQFVTASRISYIVRSVDGYGAMYLADLVSRKTVRVRIWGPSESYFWVYAWSPDGNSITYFTSTQWRIRSATSDISLSALGQSLGYNFRRNVDSDMVGFSADGQYVAVDQSNTKGALFQVVRLTDRKVVYSRGDGTMATWAGRGADLYFRIDSGLAKWDPVGGQRLVVPGLGWTNPVASADGNRIAYLSASAAGYHFARQVRLTDQPLKSIALSNLHRAGVSFLTPTVVWYAEEATCGQTPCRCDDALCEPLLTGHTYVHDLLTGVISPSIETGVADVWPHAA